MHRLPHHSEGVRRLKQTENVVIANMHTKSAMQWTPKKKSIKNKRLQRSATVLAAVCLCIGAGAWAANRETGIPVSRMSAGFEYDDTLGRLQFVSNILPESAMVFLSSDYTPVKTLSPADGPVIHTWSQEEPWLEFEAASSVSACQAGQIMTVVKNRQGEHTVRVMHEDGYESIYSGLTEVFCREADSVMAGQALGEASGGTAFELRKDGLSVLPVFSN